MHAVLWSLLSATALSGAPVIAADIGPEALVGSWTWSWTDSQGVTHRHVLEVEGSGDKLAASERFDDEEPVKVTDLKVEGRTVQFSVKRGDRRSAYKGDLKGEDVINGLVYVTVEGQATEFPWTAKRDEKKKDDE